MGMCRNYIEKGRYHAAIPGKWKMQVYRDVASEPNGEQDGATALFRAQGFTAFGLGFGWILVGV